jgi:polysaccharide pyruvyl transferase WcaK-like protein
MTKKILLINSDLATNRGDRAIAEGIIELAKQHFPDAHITGISQFPERDKQWYGIDFLDMNFQSLNPFQLLRLCYAAYKHDIVLWGGGEILKDYTNKAALWYWVIKMTCISLANKNLYGAYQGIGPTKATSSKKLITFIVNRCKTFIVRDQESHDKLISWGAQPTKVLSASDPAVLPSPQPPSSTLKKQLKDEYDIDDSFLKDFICIGPRDWFHYKPSGILPFKYKKKLYRLIGKQVDTTSKQHDLYIEQLSNAISALTKKYDTNILFVPMHMEESDTDLCRLLKDKAQNPDRVRVIDKDTLSSSQLRSLIGAAKAMVGFRLHSNIIGVSAGVPSVNIYYVDKGRVFFDQIEQSHFALPIENVLEPSFERDFLKLFDELLANRSKIRKEINTSTAKLRTSVTTAFQETFDA